VSVDDPIQNMRREVVVGEDARDATPVRGIAADDDDGW
jgi:hypothetical protein